MASKFWAPAPQPATKLGRYRQLSPLAGVHVSPLCLGAMSIGDKWAEVGFGAMDKASSFKLLDAFYDKGGNFIDTANAYQDESSEEFIGEWMEQRGVRDHMVIATKVRTSLDLGLASYLHESSQNVAYSTLPTTNGAIQTSRRKSIMLGTTSSQ